MEGFNAFIKIEYTVWRKSKIIKDQNGKADIVK